MSEFYNANATDLDNAKTLIIGLDENVKWSALFARSWAAHLCGMPQPTDRKASYPVRDLSIDVLDEVLPKIASALANVAISREGMAHTNGVAALAQVLSSAFSTNLDAFSIRLTKPVEQCPEPGKRFKGCPSYTATRFVDTSTNRYCLVSWRYKENKADILDDTKIVSSVHDDAIDGQATPVDAIGGLYARNTSSPDRDDDTLVGIEAIDASVDLNDNIVGDAAVYADRLTARSMRAASRRDRKTIRWMRKLLITQSRILKRRDATIANIANLK